MKKSVFDRIFSNKILAFMLMLFVVNKNLTFTVLTYNDTFTFIRRIILYTIYLFLIVYLIYKPFKEKKINILTIALFILSILIYVISGNTDIMILVLLISAFEKMKLTEMVKCCFYANSVTMLIVITLSMLGVLPNWLFYTSEGIANGLGYYYSTIPATYSFLLIVMFSYMKDFKLKIRHVFAMLILAISMYFVTYSATALILSLLMIAFELIYMLVLKKKSNNINKKTKRGSRIIAKYALVSLPLLIFAISIGFAFIYKNDNKIHRIINDKLSNRVVLSTEALEEYGIPLFGKKIEWYGNGGVGYVVKEVKNYNFIDNAYLRIMFDYGIIFLTILIIVYMANIEKYYEKGKYCEIFVIMLFLLWGITEPNLLEVDKNIFLVALFNDVLLISSVDFFRTEKRIKQ